MRLGDALLPLALLVWMTVSVGPWEVGAILFVFCTLVNAMQHFVEIRRKK